MKTLLRGRAPNAGVTMIEVIIATCILAIVLFMSYSILYSTSATDAQGQLTSNLEARGKQMTTQIRNLFYDAHFSDLTSYGPNNAVTGTFKPQVGIHDNGTQIHFQIVVSVDPNGSVAYGWHVDGKDDPYYQDPLGLPPNPRRYQGYSCILRFEPEIAIYEGSGTAPTVVQPTTADSAAPQTWHANPYTGYSLVPGTPLPSKSVNLDIDRDGAKTTTFVQGKIWKYVMNPFPYAIGTSDQNIVSRESFDDNVVLAVDPATGAFNGQIGPLDAGWIPGGTSSLGKDWLFRFLLSEPSPPWTYGCTDPSIPSVQSYPTSQSVAIGFTVWHMVQDERAKGYYLRRAWEKVPFRLSH